MLWSSLDGRGRAGVRRIKCWTSRRFWTGASVGLGFHPSSPFPTHPSFSCHPLGRWLSTPSHALPPLPSRSLLPFPSLLPLPPSNYMIDDDVWWSLTAWLGLCRGAVDSLSLRASVHPCTQFSPTTPARHRNGSFMSTLPPASHLLAGLLQRTHPVRSLRWRCSGFACTSRGDESPRVCHDYGPRRRSLAYLRRPPPLVVLAPPSHSC